MSELKKTSVENDHYHFVYLRDDGTGFTSEAKDGHVHDVEYFQEIQPIKDPDTQQVVNEGRAARFELKKAKGHDHKILLQSEGEDLPRSENDDSDKEREEEIIERVKALYCEAKGREKTSRKMANESFDMYKGKQWTDEAKAKLEGENRACLTINEIEPKVDVLCGYQRQNRYDITYLPVEGGDALTADVMTFVSKNVLEQNNFDFEETEAFEDMTIGGRGLLTAYIDFTRTIRGDIVIESFPWDGVYFGPHRRKDLKDCEYVVKAHWYSMQKLKELYPEHEEEFVAVKNKGLTETDSKDLMVPGENYLHPDESAEDDQTLPRNEYVDEVKKEYLVMELQKKRFRRVPVIINVIDNYIYDGQFITEKEAKMIKSIPGMNVIYKVATEMEVYKVANDLLLEENYSDDDTFDVIPAYAKKKGDTFWGKVESVKDPQREVNKRHSSMVDIINKMSNYGWFYTGETFPNQAEEKKFEQNAAKPGFVQKIRDMNARPMQVEGVRFPNEIAQLEEMSSAKIREIMNVNQEMMGMGPQSQSGVAIAEKRRQGLIGNEFLFDNFSLARRMLGRRLFKLIQQVYTPERIMRLIEDKKKKDPKAKIGETAVGEISIDMLEEILAEIDSSRYDVVVSESAHSPSKRTANFIVWSEMAKQGAPIPFEFLVELSDLPNKAKVIEKYEQQQAQAAQAEQAKNDTEIQKTLIAKGGQ